MTRSDVRDLLIRRGFVLIDLSSNQHWTDIEHNGEMVGRIYEDSVNIANNYPSLNPSRLQSYANTENTCVLFTSPMKMLEEAIDFLLDSPSRMDRELREKRVENVRKYFEDKAIEKKWSIFL